MCGRFSLRLNHNDIQQLDGYNVDIGEWVDEQEFVPRYNIAPRTQAPVIRRRDPAKDNDNSLIMQTMKWGLVPSWRKTEDKSLNTTNARSENLVQGGGMWGSIKGKKRCAIPCQGYYEWLTKGKDKLPHFTKRKDGKLLLMAGLYDSVVLEGKTLWTFTIVTTDANKEFSWLHDRQPVFLSNREALYRWLDTSSQSWTPELTKMVQPYSDTSVPLECYQVPKEVGKVGTESSTFIEPIGSRKGGIKSMFSKQREKSPSKAAPESPTKRKLEASSPPAEPQSETESLEPSSSSQESDAPHNKRLKTEPILVDDSNQPQNTGSPCGKQKVKSSPAKKAARKAATPGGNAKISSFFGKR
ncbi:hypothetical protein CPB84DRAFT_1778339 [Gymnopilus junonius]|uniref:DUF159-domain-containing protein n=1 Tax=Gymnopilus junonius TaxID=109634 RepID=A0A9P5TP25_GYMJU|nr:hypothetical protein CPB84DRAFT_1778339 [Gymnopilus junonius]